MISTYIYVSGGARGRRRVFKENKAAKSARNEPPNPTLDVLRCAFDPWFPVLVLFSAHDNYFDELRVRRQLDQWVVRFSVALAVIRSRIWVVFPDLAYSTYSVLA